MATDADQHYSTLEAVQYHAIPETDTSKQVVPDAGKVVYEPNGGIEVTQKHDNEYTGAEGLPEYIATTNNATTPKPRSRRKWIIIGVIAAVVILGAVLGGVLGTVLGKSKSSSTSSSAATGTGTPTSTGTPSTTATATNLSKYNLAAVSFTDSKVNATRLYYQDNSGNLIEAATSASKSTWSSNALGFSAVNGSAIAAAVSRPGFTLEISVFYTDSKYVIHDIIYNHTSATWQSGVISAKGYTTLSNGSITALYNQCRLCANTTIIAFQDSNGFIQTANKTSAGWTLSQLDITATEGTGLALQTFYRYDQVDQINLYHQKSSLNLSLASYKDPQNNNGVYGWSTSEQVYLVAPYGTPIAASSSYQNITNGAELWIELLSVSSRGIQVDTWKGGVNDWIAHETHPSAMSNSTTNPKLFGAVAMTAMGSAYAVVESVNGTLGISSWQVADDDTDWTEIGNVNIGSAWG